MEINMEIGERIKKRREELNISQAKLAKMVGYTSRSSIAKLETNANGMTQSKIIEFAKALKTTPSYLMGWTEDTSNSVENLITDPPILKKYNELNTIGQCKADAYIDGLLENEAYRKNNISKEITYSTEVAAFGGASKTGEITKETLNQLVDELENLID